MRIARYNILKNQPATGRTEFLWTTEVDSLAAAIWEVSWVGGADTKRPGGVALLCEAKVAVQIMPSPAARSSVTRPRSRAVGDERRIIS